MINLEVKKYTTKYVINELREISNRLEDLNKFDTDCIDFRYRANQLYKLYLALAKLIDEEE